MFYFQDIALFTYNINCLLLFQLKHVGVVAERTSMERWDLGSIPRSTQSLYFLFLYMFTCRFPKAGPPCIPDIQVPSVSRQQSKDQERGNTMLPSQLCHGQLQKGQTCLATNGPQISKQNPLLAHHPP